FFQAEDGIRDKLVTGVQTCALPICYFGPTLISSGIISLTGNASLSSSSAVTVNGTLDLGGLNDTIASLSGTGNVTLGSGTLTVRSEERRVGKEGRTGGVGSRAMKGE